MGPLTNRDGNFLALSSYLSCKLRSRSFLNSNTLKKIPVKQRNYQVREQVAGKQVVLIISRLLEETNDHNFSLSQITGGYIIKALKVVHTSCLKNKVCR